LPGLGIDPQSDAIAMSYKDLVLLGLNSLFLNHWNSISFSGNVNDDDQLINTPNDEASMNLYLYQVLIDLQKEFQCVEF